jgi:hypothetical protein
MEERKFSLIIFRLPGKRGRLFFSRSGCSKTVLKETAYKYKEGVDDRPVKA